LSEDQICYALREVESGRPPADVCRLGISEATFYVWKKKCARLGVTTPAAQDVLATAVNRWPSGEAAWLRGEGPESWTAVGPLGTSP
jgi:Transposase